MWAENVWRVAQGASGPELGGVASPHTCSLAAAISRGRWNTAPSYSGRHRRRETWV